ncbi:hypothetical protein [Paenibacillus sp. J2TS4]|uniref:hypothetical protein n=1 Tax=Paenibacillus sp. J2TS4 TaxID=2807194 RepID=UPI001BCB1D17|nr:hypothetical protein [Paenibacillus sp. J2TS4]
MKHIIHSKDRLTGRTLRLPPEVPLSARMSVDRINDVETVSSSRTVDVRGIGVEILMFRTTLRLPVQNHYVLGFELGFEQICIHIQGQMLWRVKGRDSYLYGSRILPERTEEALLPDLLNKLVLYRSPLRLQRARQYERMSASIIQMPQNHIHLLA